MTMRGCLKQREKLDEKEKVYYEYTCGMGDVVRMMDIPSPKMTEDDLIAETCKANAVCCTYFLHVFCHVTLLLFYAFLLQLDMSKHLVDTFILKNKEDRRKL